MVIVMKISMEILEKSFPRLAGRVSMATGPLFPTSKVGIPNERQNSFMISILIKKDNLLMMFK